MKKKICPTSDRCRRTWLLCAFVAAAATYQRRKTIKDSGGFEGVARPKFLRPQNKLKIDRFEGAGRPNWTIRLS